MTWIPAIAAGGLVLALGPVLIHILFRWRYQVVEFAAFRFLLESRRRSRRRLRWEELLLIALRVLACLLVGLTLADVRSARSALGGSSPRAHLFVLDDSLSMGQQAAGTTLYQRACAHIERRLEDLAPGDTVAVIWASRPEGGDFEARLMSLAEARGSLPPRLSASRPTGLRADFPAAIRAAAGLVARQGPTSLRLELLSDFRQADFTGPQAAATLQAALAALDDHNAEVILRDFGLPCRSNLSIEAVALGRNVPVAGVSTPLRVSLRNTGVEPAPATRLEIFVGEATLPVQPVSALDPGELTVVEVPCVFEAPGSTAVRAVLPSDDLPADSDVALALEVREALKILVVDGSANPADEDSASYALARALDPSGQGKFGRRVDVYAAASWNPAALASYDAVVLANVREFPAAADERGQTSYPALRALEDYVRAGGGLAIFAGDALSTDFYNGPFYAGDRGLLPLPLADRPLPKPDRERFVRVDPQSVADTPMLRLFSSRGPNFSRFVRFFAVAPAVAADPNAHASATVLASFDNGMPAVARRTFGGGSVVMWYSSADSRWTNWPGDLSFLPAMNDMAWELARIAENEFDDCAGRAIGYTLPARLAGAATAMLKTPAYPREDIQPLPIQDDGRRRTLAYRDTVEAGLYEMTLALPDRTQHRTLFSRRPDPRESELSRIAQDDLLRVIGRPCQYIAEAADSPSEKSGPASALWWCFLAGLMFVLALEGVLALRFGHYVRTVTPALEPTP